jgi:phenylalanyl-tRNA synthetase alpha chain
MGLEPALLLRKSIPDIRYPPAQDTRIAAQMLNLEPWQHASPLPAAKRDVIELI